MGRDSEIPPCLEKAGQEPIPAEAKPTKKIQTIEGFVLGALAACGAVTATNPMEVAKTRLQLDGELQSRQKPGEPPRMRTYTSAFDAMKKAWRFDGIPGLQRGLGAAYCYQILLNGSRLGFYEPFRQRFNRLGKYEDVKQVHFWSSVVAGASSGAVGASLGNPLFLVKARMQAYSPHNPVGAQHSYPNALYALRDIYRKENVKGLLRGIDAAILRTVMGSSVQLPSYNYAKSWLAPTYLPADSPLTYLLASSFSGACVCLMMQPADTALTRMYNQSPDSVGPDGKPRGLLYKNPIDCLWKTFKAEGVRGWYKGTTAHFLRIAPHTVMTLVFNELLTETYLKYLKS